MPRQFASAATGWRSARGSSSWRRSRSALLVRLRRRDPRADPAVLGRRVHVLHARPGRDGRATGCATGARLAVAARRSTPSARVLTAVVLGDRRVREVRRRRYLVVILIPVLVGMMLFINRQYAALGAAARGPTRRSSSRRRTARSGSIVPVAGDQPGRRPGDQRRPARSPTTSGPSTSATSPTRRPRSASAGSARCRACRWSSWSRRTGRWSGRCVAYLDVLDRGLAAGQARPDHVRRDPRVRRPQLVGADPLQPVGEAAAGGAARPAAHGRRQRPVPARGPDPVRDGQRRDRGLDGRHVGGTMGRVRGSAGTPRREPGARG